MISMIIRSNVARISMSYLLKKVGSFHFLLSYQSYQNPFYRSYSSSSKLIASLVVASTSYSSLLPTIMLSNSFCPEPAGMR
jgi:hypothetical protein